MTLSEPWRLGANILLLAALLPHPSLAAAAPRPNIVLILADDLGYADVGFNGATDIPTPALDKLAANGMIFSSAYVAHPVCGPSRAGIMTGRYPHKFGAQDNLPNFHPEMGITLSETFIAKVLRDAGYTTAAIGKWHLGEAPQFQPNQRGFDEYFGFLGSGHAYFPDRYEAIYRREVEAGNKAIAGNISPLQRNGAETKATEYLTDAFSHEAVRFIREAAKKDKPFFLYLAYNAPHVPLEAKAEDIEKLANISDKKRRTYAAMIYAIDRGVSEVVDALKSIGRFENTLIVFLSDNGGKSGGPANNGPLRGGKRNVTEGGSRVPMFFHWPRQLPGGRKFDFPVLALDFYPTFAGLAGAAIPAGKQHDGKDVWKDLLAGRNPHPYEMIFVMSHLSDHTDAAGRLDEWKIYRERDKPWRLINIEEDIGEQRDLAAQNPEKVRDLVGQVQKWAGTHQQPLWHYNTDEDPVWAKNKKPYFDGTFDLLR